MTKQNVLSKILLNCDRFQEPVQLNFNGKKKVPSFIGLLMTLLCITVIGIYGVQRFQLFFFRLKPEVTSSVVKHAFGARDEIDLRELGFKIAFGVIDFRTGKPLRDETRMQWQVNMR